MPLKQVKLLVGRKVSQKKNPKRRKMSKRQFKDPRLRKLKNFHRSLSRMKSPRMMVFLLSNIVQLRLLKSVFLKKLSCQETKTESKRNELKQERNVRKKCMRDGKDRVKQILLVT